jgi:hypothetical protein
MRHQFVPRLSDRFSCSPVSQPKKQKDSQMTAHLHLGASSNKNRSVSICQRSSSISDIRWKRIEANMIAGPARTLERRAFAAAVGAAGAGTQLVAGGVRPPTR